MHVRRMVRLIFLAGAVVAADLPRASAQLLVSFDFAGGTGSEVTRDANFVAAGLTAPVTISRGTGLTATANADRFNAQGWGETSADNALANGDYFEWTVTPDAGGSMSITQIAFQVQRSNTGASNLALRTSADGFTANLNALTNFAGNNTTVPSVFDSSGVVELQGVSSAVTFRVLGWTGAAGGSMGFEGAGNDIQLWGTVTSGSPVTNVKFTASSAAIGEAGGAYTVTVYKTLPSGDVSGSVSLGGTATSGTDYTIDTTNFTMNGAVTSAIFVISIIDDSDPEVAETVLLTLTNVSGGTISWPSEFTLTINDNDVPPPPSGEPWINEFNYDPPGTDSNEFVELAGPAGLDLSNYLLVLYNGTGNVPYSNAFLSGTIPDEGCGFGAVAFDTPGLQNGSPDGIALAKISGGITTLVQFISYEGSMTGVGGPADGQPSQDVGAQNGIIDTLQLAGSGTNYAAFTWVTGTVSRGVLNVGQTISPCGGGTTNVQFTLASASIGEAGGAYTVTVYKTLASGDVSGSVSLGGTATPGTDYTIDTTNFTMNGAVTSATFVITITDDAAIESTETVILTIATVDGGNIAAPSVFTLSITDNDVLGPAPSLNVWINEFHYDNTGTDVDEGVEVAGPAGLDLAGYSLWLYDGACACHYETTNLTGVIPNQSNGFGTVWFPIVGIQNGPDAIALVYGTTQVIQFISYEGVFTATNGPASDMTSVDVGVFQPTTGPVGHSLQLCGSGTNYAAFAWSTNRPHTRGLINDCQTIPGGSGYSPAQQSYIITWWGSLGAYTGDGADDDGDFFSNLEEFIAGTIPVPPTGSNSFFRGIAITNSATRFVVTPSVTGRLYRLWSATNLLGTQVWSQVAGPVAGTGANISMTDGVATNYRMFKLSVELENP